MFKSIFNKKDIGPKFLIGLTSTLAIVGIANAFVVSGVTLYHFIIALAIIAAFGVISYLVGSVIVYVVEEWFD